MRRRNGNSREAPAGSPKAKRDFIAHLMTFLGMAVFFIVLNAVTSWGNWWFYWPVMGWGIGLFFHFVHAYRVGGVGFDRALGIDQDERSERRPELLPFNEEEKEELELRDPIVQKKWKDEDLV